MEESLQDSPLIQLAGGQRFATYLQATCGDRELACKLYHWNTETASSFFRVFSYLEIALRNHMDRSLPANWALPRQTPEPIYRLLGKKLRAAQKTALSIAKGKDREVSHGDVLAQLSFGSWCHLIGKTTSSAESKQQQLWEEYFALVFKQDTAENERVILGQSLERLRKIRNRIAHHENLLKVNLHMRLQDTLVILKSLDEEYVNLIETECSLSELLKSDPRKQ